MRPQLVLDVGGVLLSNLTGFWRSLPDAAGVPYEAIRSAYKQEMREALWCGRSDEPGFWRWLAARWPGIDPTGARQALIDSMQPLPALALLPAWSRLADVHILSNHRAEWLRPLLAPHLPHLASLTVSSEAGCAKPNAAIYEAARRNLPLGAPVLFVDDKRSNLRASEAFGWHTLLADEQDHAWTAEVEPRLCELGESSQLRADRRV